MPKKKKQSGPPSIVMKFERGDLVSWHEDGRQLTGFIRDVPGSKVPAGHLDVRARGDTLGRLLPISHAQLRLKRKQVDDYWYWL
jgi:hypothetical protein